MEWNQSNNPQPIIIPTTHRTLIIVVVEIGESATVYVNPQMGTLLEDAHTKLEGKRMRGMGNLSCRIVNQL